MEKIVKKQLSKASDEVQRKTEKEIEDDKFKEARINIRWTIQHPSAFQRYLRFKQTMSKYDAVLMTQAHNPHAQVTIRSYGESRTTAYINELGG